MLRRVVAVALFSTLTFSALVVSPVSAISRSSRPSVVRSVSANAERVSALVRYQAPASTGGNRITGYNVEAHPSGRLYFCRTTRCVVRGLKAGVSYYFTVAALTRVGRGAFSRSSNHVTPQPLSVTITFDANGCTGATPGQSARYSVPVVLRENAFTCAGSTFSGWNTLANAHGVEYANGGTYRFNSNVILYAQWSLDTYLITFDANGCTGAMPGQSARYSVPVTLSVNAFTCAGSTFSGWNTLANASGTSYANVGTYAFSSNVTLYAQWSLDTYLISFNANGCSGTMASQSATYGVALTLSANAFTCAGSTFSGWNTLANAGGTGYANAGTYAFSSNVTLYAQWTAVAPIPSAQFTGTSSSNWSGYALSTNSVVTYASGQWTVPTLNCAATPNSTSSTWVGTGGWVGASAGTSNVLLQTGIEDSCLNGYQRDSGWWEMYPGTPNQEEVFSNFPVNPGDVISAEVYQSTSGQWVTVLQDLTSGLQGVMQMGGAWDVTTISSNSLVGAVQGSTAGQSYSGAMSAEWIVEDPTESSAGSLAPFANYSSVTFTNLRTSLASWSLSNSNAVELIQGGAAISVPSGASAGGFTCTYY